MEILMVMAVLVSCGRRQKGTDDGGVEAMTVEVRLKTTPVKDQRSSGLCWAYAMLATIETEHLMQGDSVNLSVDYVARNYIAEQAREMFLLRTGEISTRGMAPTLIRLIETYGLNHYDAFHCDSTTDYDVVCRKVAQLAQATMTYGRFDERLGKLLDDDIHPVIPRVYWLGAVYSPLEFAHSVCRDDEYASYTSFTHHPFGEAFPIEVPDNRYHDTFMNVPVDTLMNIIIKSIRNGHPVCWEGDISEPGFLFDRGVADLKTDGDADVQEERQLEFENHQTTDDHCMEIVGIAHDGRGKRFFIMKNSWGTRNPLHGFMYVSFDYARLKTVGITARKFRCP